MLTNCDVAVVVLLGNRMNSLHTLQILQSFSISFIILFAQFLLVVRKRVGLVNEVNVKAKILEVSFHEMKGHVMAFCKSLLPSTLSWVLVL
jgi:hypothetical protein